MSKVSVAIGAALFLISPAHARSKPQVVFESACACRGNHGVARWAAKTDLTEPPNDSSIQPITPSQIFEWKGPGGNMPRGAGRIPAEQQWFALTGRVEKLRVEDDGDLHLVLANVDNKPGEAVIEIPLGERWCELRRTIFSWTDARFPFATGRSPFRLIQNPTITAVGRAFYDTDHSGNTRNNRREYDQHVAVWELHPVMKLALATSLQKSVPQTSQLPSITPEVGVPTPVNPPPAQFATITRPVIINIPYGLTTLRPGMKLRIVSRTADAVIVQYLDGSYSVPITSTDLK